VKQNQFCLPRRFTCGRTGCGFVFISLVQDKSQYWENALTNFTSIYKYKHKLEKCLGVVVFKVGNYFDFNWAFIEHEWTYNQDLEDAVKAEEEFYNPSESIEIERYKFK
jgi:hypothetical protein